ncbi:MAG: three-Cys-motif partner protein TcmP [Pyrinomonadaceae bacterium]|nr:three-Cys-motif partner protein TcmP [Pyrinomonadaceae bacterium]
MPPKKFPTLWKAEPHTIAKIEILQSYLVAWFQIFGQSRSRRDQDLLYVDGFAGPGEYTNHPIGSPLAALTAAQHAIELTGIRWIAGDVHCAFIEPDLERYKNLEQKIGSFDKPAMIVTHAYPETFTRGLESLKKDIPQPFSSQHPLFVFIDPFGATGVPFSVVAELLKSPCSEVLINLDADGIARIFQAGESAAHEKNLNEIFAGDEWKPLFDAGDPLKFFAGRCSNCTRPSSGP